MCKRDRSFNYDKAHKIIIKKNPNLQMPIKKCQGLELFSKQDIIIAFLGNNSLSGA